MSDSIERLRKSKEAFHASESELGERHGRDWANLSADYADLEALAARFGDEFVVLRQVASVVLEKSEDSDA